MRFPLPPWPAVSLVLAGTTTLGGCLPELDQPVGRVESLTVLAVRAEPAEARPGETVRVEALVADPRGPRPDAAPTWGLCTSRKPLKEPGPVDPACLRGGPTLLVGGSAPALSMAVPANACKVFGPDRAPASPGAPASRPADPDTTGGYYQPLVVSLPSAAPERTSFGLRITCPPSGLTAEQQKTLAERNGPNANPVLSSLAVEQAGTFVDVPSSPESAPVVTAGASIALRVRWPPCVEGAPCQGAETYALFDPAERAIVTAQERLRVTWSVTAGELPTTGTGPDDGDALASTNTWSTPAAAGPVAIWAVLRDDRGGVGYRSGWVRVANP